MNKTNLEVAAMPLVGFGCWNLDKSMASQCVKDAIRYSV